MKEIIFFDLDQSFINEITKLFCPTGHHKISVYHGSIEDLLTIYNKNICIFSPANSFLFFDGGIDAVYQKIYPKLQSTAQQKLRELPHKTNLGRNYLPIGSAMMIKVDQINNHYVVACPTMFRPQNIQNTRNVYHAFYAGLSLANKYPTIDTLLVPGLGMGWGKISAEESAKQIYEAYLTCASLNPPAINFRNNMTIYFDEPNRDEQPNYYENLELKGYDNDFTYK